MSVAVIVKENGVPKDCTGFLCAYILKEKDLKTAPMILNKAITWTNAAVGEGFFTVTFNESNNLQVRTYFNEIILYLANNTYRKTVSKDKLAVKQSLGTT